LYIVKQRLCDLFVQNWQGRLEQPSRARFYKKIYQLLGYNNTFNYILIFSKYRYAMDMSKLRRSSHRLHIETDSK